MAKTAKKTVKKAKAKAPAAKAAKSSVRSAPARTAAKKSAGSDVKYAQSGAPWWKQYLPS